MYEILATIIVLLLAIYFLILMLRAAINAEGKLRKEVTDRLYKNDDGEIEKYMKLSDKQRSKKYQRMIKKIQDRKERKEND